MNTFQTAVMNTVKISCILFILKVTQCIDGQTPGTAEQLGYNKIDINPDEARSLVKSLSYVYDRPQFVKRRLDRFRFFHKGLGKRTDTSHVNTKELTGVEDDKRVLEKLKTIVDQVNKFQNMRPYDQQYLMATNPNFFLKNTKTFRWLLGMNYLTNKRTPEFFSENLYPLQSGKQKLEASLDHTLDRVDDTFDNLVDIGNAEEDSIPVTSEVTDNVPLDRFSTKTPFDLIFASPDLRTESKTSDQYKSQDRVETGVNDGQVSKRWWAANMFSKFRSPKSWNRGIKSAKHVDPAIYFIGLGR